MMRKTGIPLALLALSLSAARAETIQIKDDASLRKAVAAARPGTHISIAPGRYRSGLAMTLVGTERQPIVIEGTDAKNPPVFDGGQEAMHLSACAYVTLRNIACRGQSDNGINIDDGGQLDKPAHHIVLENVHISDTGPEGNHDAIKLSGVEHFVIRNCSTEGWGGQAVDMVGCHHGIIEASTFRGKKGFSQHTGPQAKGATSDITVRRCTFIDAGARAMQIGGSTGLQFFRPLGAKYEAKDITVEGCTFIGAEAPITFVGVDGAVVRYNTFYHPEKWIMRILQETTAEGFAPCRNGRFEHNMIVYRGDALQPPVNVGPNTSPQTFSFASNLWFREDRPQSSRPELPTPERDGVYGIDPKFKDAAQLDFTPTADTAKRYGHTAMPIVKARISKSQ